MDYLVTRMRVGRELLSSRMLLKTTLPNFLLLLAAFCSLLSVTMGRPLTIKRCGIVDPKRRIVGGHRAQDGAYPWMVSLYEKDDSGEYDHVCGGAILNEHWIVTAAHCIYFRKEPERYGAYVGVQKLSKRDRWQSREYKINRIVIHEDFDSDSHDNDIALLRTKAPIDFVVSRGYVNGICLPETEEDPEGWAIVTGWGHTKFGGENSDELQTVKVPLVPREICNVAYDYDPDDGIQENILDTQICAGATQMDSCQNDSGGPLIQRDARGIHTLIGIVSHGMVCGDPDFPGVYTKVASYRDWLEENIQN